MNEEAFLIVVVNGKDADGFPVETETRIPVWAREKSATRSEVYMAMRADVSVKKVFEIRQEDYELSAHLENDKKVYATRLSHEGADYNIVRTYKPNKAIIELTCS